MFGAGFQVGSLCITAAMIGLSKMGGSWSWRIPLLLEALFPAIVCATIFFLNPESPRYYVMRRKPDAVRRVIAQYHTTNGDMNQPIVDMVVSQIEASIENDRVGSRSSRTTGCFSRGWSDSSRGRPVLCLPAMERRRHHHHLLRKALLLLLLSIPRHPDVPTPLPLPKQQKKKKKRGLTHKRRNTRWSQPSRSLA